MADDWSWACESYATLSSSSCSMYIVNVGGVGYYDSLARPHSRVCKEIGARTLGGLKKGGRKGFPRNTHGHNTTVVAAWLRGQRICVFQNARSLFQCFYIVLYSSTYIIYYALVIYSTAKHSLCVLIVTCVLITQLLSSWVQKQWTCAETFWGAIY